MRLTDMDYNNYLTHHGIKGQKWGIKNGPPYPLGASDHSASERKAGWRASLSSNLTNKKVNDNSGFHLTDKQKKYIKIGAAVAGAALVTYGAYKTYQMFGPATANYLGMVKYGRSDPLINTIKDYSDKSVTLKPGTTIQRISRYKTPDYVDVGHTYVSYFFNDKMHYKTGLNKEIIWKSNSTYVHNIKINKTLKAPSTKEAATIYHELFPNAVDQNFWLTMTNGFINRTSDDPTLIAVQNRALKFKTELLNRGFNALIDIEDARSRTAPLIVLDTSIFGSDSVHKLGKVETLFATVMR